jgi:hypothetical protein
MSHAWAPDTYQNDISMISFQIRGRRGRARNVVGFTISYAINCPSPLML